MKKIILLIAAVALATGAFAQFSWGVKTGLNLSTLTNFEQVFQEVEELNSSSLKTPLRPDFYAGAFVEYKFGDVISLQAEAIYSRQGGQVCAQGDIDETITRSDNKIGVRMGYINIPILVKVYLFERLSIEVGPQLGLLAHSKAVIKSHTNVVEDGIKVKSSLTMKYDLEDTGLGSESIDLALAMGATYSLTDKVDVSARYNLGLTNAIKAGDKAMKNGALQIGVGYRF